MSNFDSMTNINYLVFIWNVFVDTLLLLIVYAWKMYDMQTLHAGGIPMFRNISSFFAGACNHVMGVGGKFLILMENVPLRNFLGS